MKRLLVHARERLLAIAAVVLVGCWGLMAWVVQPLWDYASELGQRIEVQTERLQAMGRLLRQKERIEREYQDLSVYFSSEPEEQVQASFLNQLEVLSSRFNLRLNLKPKPGKREGRLSRFEVELDLEGSQDKLFQFLDALLGLPTLITVERIRISHAPTRERALHANLVLQRLIQQGPQ